MPLWITYLDRLVILKLENCQRLVELPQLSRLQSLKELCIEDMCSMLTIEGCMLNDPESMFFPSLETLCIEDMPNLRSWWSQEPTVLPTFPRVTKVEISNCAKLTSSMPLFPLVEDLWLYNVKEEVMWQGIGSGLATGLGNNSVLKTLRMYRIGNLRSMGEAQMSHLSSLRKLRIYGCTELDTVSCRGLAYLTSLEELNFFKCPKLKWWIDGDDEEKAEVPWGHLHKLKCLGTSNVKRSFFKGFKYMTCLQELSLYDFNEELQNVPPPNSQQEEGMPWKHLRKLRRMHVEFGETFSTRGNQHLLKGVEHITSLRHLTLRSCEELYLSWSTLLSLHHLESLGIEHVEKVIEVDYSPQTQLISKLQRLRIQAGSRKRLPKNIPWKSFASLQSLELKNISELEVARDGIQHLVCLQNLEIDGGSAEWVCDILPWKSFPFLQYLRLRDISNLEALPEGIQHLHDLQRFWINGCKKVESLPYWISSLSSLRQLYIYGSSEELKRRCHRPTGEDCPLIHHIPHIYIT